MNSGPKPSILGLISILEIVGVDFYASFPLNVRHFKSFIFLSKSLKEFKFYGSAFQYLRNCGVFLGICKDIY